MTILGRGAQGVEERRARAFRPVERETELARDAIGDREADAAHRACKSIRIRAHELLRLCTKLAQHGRRLARPETDPAQECVQLVAPELGLHRAHERLAHRPAQSDHASEPLGLAMDHFDGVHAELLDDAARERLADSLERVRGEVAHGAFLAERRQRLAALEVELASVRAVARPLAAEAQALTRARPIHRTDRRHAQRAPQRLGLRIVEALLRCDAQHRVLRLGIVEGDDLDLALQQVAVGPGRLARPVVLLRAHEDPRRREDRAQRARAERRIAPRRSRSAEVAPTHLGGGGAPDSAFHGAVVPAWRNAARRAVTQARGMLTNLFAKDTYVHRCQPSAGSAPAAAREPPNPPSRRTDGPVCSSAHHSKEPEAPR